MLLLLALSRGSAQTAQLSIVTPAGASSQVSINITGTGFHTTAANNEVSFVPATGAAMTASATAIATVDAARDLRRITVRVPSGLATGTAALRVRNTVTGLISEGKSLEVIALSLPDVSSATPGTSNLDVRITGSANTSFVAGKTQIGFGTGITVNSVAVKSPTELVANITIPASVAPSVRTLQMSSAQLAVLPGAFTIAAAPPPNQNPTANAGGPYAGQTGAAIAFNGSGTDADGDTLTLTWNFGDQATGSGASPNHAYAVAGTYTATVTVNDGHGGTASAQANVVITDPPPPPNHDPTANAGGPYAGQTGAAIAFNGSGTDADGDTLTFVWNFGDQSTGSGASPNHAYATAGTYTATLTVSDGRGGTATAQANVVVTNPPPPPNHDPTANAGGPYSGQTHATIAFLGSGTDADGDTLTLAWNFGDQTTGSGASPNHAYAVAGTYVASLTVNDGHGGIASAQATVVIADPPPPPNHAPTANAGGPYSGQTHATIAFLGSGTDADGDTLTLTWNFGDQTTGSGASPNHAYAVAGTYVATLTVNDGHGGIASVQANVVITNPPIVNRQPTASPGGPYASAVGAAIAFSGVLSNDPDHDTLSFAWLFGDGSTAAGVAPTHAYALTGTYTATLIVSDGRGGVDTATTFVQVSAVVPVNGSPIANAGGPYVAVTGQAVSLSAAASSDPDNDPLLFAWTFGDGQSATGPSPSHTYAHAGEYAVSLLAADGRGGSDLASARVIVSEAAVGNRAPSVTSGGPYAGLTGSAVGFAASGLDPDNDALTFAWSFGDGSSGTGATPSHSYLAPGPYAVVVTVSDQRGGSASASTTAAISSVAGNTPPTASAGGPYLGAPGQAIAFNFNASSDADNDLLSFSADFGDGGTGTGNAPIHPYLQAGTYVVTLVVSDGRGGTSVATTSAVITGQTTALNAAPVAGAGGPYAGSPGQPVQFDGSASSDPDADPLTFSWSFGDGTTGTNASPSHSYANPGQYSVALLVSDGRGGMAAASATAIVAIAAPQNQPPTASAGGPYSVIVGESLSFNGAGVDADGDTLTLSWNFGDGSSGLGSGAAHVYQHAGDYRVVLLISDGRGGSATAEAMAHVTARPTENGTPVANAGGPYTSIPQTLVAFNGSQSIDPDGDALTYAWNFGDGTGGSGPAPSHAYVMTGAYVVVLTVTDARGQSASSSTSAVIGAVVDRGPPIVTLSAPTEALPGSSVVVTATAADDVAVTAVTFEVSGATTSEATTAPYRRIVQVPSVAAPGAAIHIRAIARDPSNNTAQAETDLRITFQPDTENPYLSLVLPPSGTPGASVLISATAVDNVGIARVIFLVGGVPISEDEQAPYEATVQVPASAVAGSSLPITARAVDFSGNAVEGGGALSIVAVADTIAPTVSLVAPAQILRGSTLHLSAIAADNTAVYAVTFFINDVPITTDTTAPYVADLPLGTTQTAGTILDLRAVARDFAGLEGIAIAQSMITAPAQGGRGIVTGEVYDDTTSLPLAGATVLMTGRDDEGAAYAESTTSDARGRYILRANTGVAVLRIGRNGWTRVDRTVTIVSQRAVEALDGRLTRFIDPAVVISPVLGGVVGPAADRLTLQPGALQAEATLALTRIGQQGLEGLLPPGWSPVGGADVSPHDLAFNGTAQLRVSNRFGLTSGTALVVARWDETATAWRALGTAIVGGPTDPLQADLPGGGQYAWLVADTAPAAPPQAVAGEVLGGVAAGALPAVEQTLIDPQPRVLFYRPGVRSDVRGAITSTSPISSGLLIEARIVESYSFLAGTRVRPQPFVEDLVFYQVSGPASGLAASFGVTPSQTFDPLTLQQGVITVELSAPALGPRVISSIGPDGGLALATSGESLQVPPGAITDSLAVTVLGLTPAELGLNLPAGLHVEGAALVGFLGTLAQPAALSIPKPAALADTASLLLIHAQEILGETRLVLVGRGHVVSNRIVSDTTLDGVEAFEGIRTAGRYLFVTASSVFGFARGQVSGPAGEPFAGALVIPVGLPIVSLSRSTGAYAAASVVGPVALTARDLVNADTGVASGTLTSAAITLALDVQITLSVPRVTSVTPADGGTNIALSDPIVVRFSKAIAPASINGANAGNVRLIASNGTPVLASVILSSADSVVTLRPSTALQPNTAYEVIIATGVIDVSGRSLPAEVRSHFTSLDTVAPPMPAAGAISAAIPGTDGFTTITATQGTAGAHDTVTVINLTRRTTTPVLLEPNGGFTVRVAAAIGDRLQIVITDANGNQTVVPLARFTRTNGDGSVSVFVGAEGGRVEGAGGTAVDVFAGTFPAGAVVTIRPVTEAAFPVQMPPAERAFYTYAGGFDLDFGGAVPTRYVNVSVPAAAGDAATDQWLVGQVAELNGRTVLNMVDTAKLIGGRVTTSSPPCPGVTAAGVYGVHKSTRPIGLTWGSMASRQTTFDMMATSDASGIYAAAGAGNNPDSLLDAIANVTPVCLPVLTGRVTVTQNSVTVGIAATEFRLGDELVTIKNVRTGSESRFNRDNLFASVILPGTASHVFSATAQSPNGSNDVNVQVVADSPGQVRVLVPIDAVLSPVTEVDFSNSTTNVDTTIPVGSLNVRIPVAGGVPDLYSVRVNSSITGDRPMLIGAITPSSIGPQHLVLRALSGTIDPTQDEIDVYNLAHPLDPIRNPRPRSEVRFLNLTDGTNVVVPPAAIVNGAIAWSFDGDLSDRYQVWVYYVNAPADFIDIPVFTITVTNAAGAPVKVITLPSPPPNDPVALGPLTDDTTPPVLTTRLRDLQNFDPAGVLTLTFDEGISLATIKPNFRVLDKFGQKVPGDIVISARNRTLTFVPETGFALGEHYTIRLLGLTDPNGNPVDPSRNYLLLATIAPRKVSELHSGANPVRTLEGLKDIQIQRRTVLGQLQTTLLAVTDAASGVGFKFVTIDVTHPTTPVETGHTSNGATPQRLTLLPGVSNLSVVGPNPCEPTSSTFTGDIGLTTTYNSLFSFVSFYDVSDRTQPCLLGNRLLTANPETLSAFSNPGTVHAVGYARGVAALQHEGFPTATPPVPPGFMAYTAVSEIGIFPIDISRNIPEILPANRVRGPVLAGDYIDIVAVSNRLVALNRGTQQLEVVDPSLTVLTALNIPDHPRRLLYVPGLPYDTDGNGQIASGEHINAAVIGADRSVIVVDLTNILNPQLVSSIRLPAIVRDVDVDREKLRLFAATDAAWHIIDLGKKQVVGIIDEDHNGVDDRVAWSRTSSDNLYSIEADTVTNHIYLGTSKGLEIYDLGAPNLTGVAEYTAFRMIPRPPTPPADCRLGTLGPAQCGGLDLAHPERKPIRGALVELQNNGAVVATTYTDSTGYYAFDAPPAASTPFGPAAFQVAVKAVLGAAGVDTVRVVDNTNGDKVWEKKTIPFSILGPTVRDIYAETEWVATPIPAAPAMPLPSYQQRYGAPFSILDTVYQAMTKVREAEPSLVFPPLKIQWSTTGTDAAYDASTVSLELGGLEDVNTDEYDTQVVLHEWFHYFVDQFGRSDSPGGSHSSGDFLDPRVAFNEGFATAFAGMVTNNSYYGDTKGIHQFIGLDQKLEEDSAPAGGFFNEDSIIELIWDLFDPKASTENNAETGVSNVDDVEIEFKRLYQALRKQRTTAPFVTIFSFLHELGAAILGDAAVVELALAENIDLGDADGFEMFTTTSIGGVPVGRLYTDIPVNVPPISEHGPGPFNTGTTSAIGRQLRTRLSFNGVTLDAAGDGNKLYGHVFFKFQIATAGQYIIDLTPVGPNRFNEGFELTLNQSGVVRKFNEFSNGYNFGGGAMSPAIVLQPGTYVVSVRSAINLGGGSTAPGPAQFTIQVRTP